MKNPFCQQFYPSCSGGHCPTPKSLIKKCLSIRILPDLLSTSPTLHYAGVVHTRHRFLHMKLKNIAVCKKYYWQTKTSIGYMPSYIGGWFFAALGKKTPALQSASMLRGFASLHSDSSKRPTLVKSFSFYSCCDIQQRALNCVKDYLYDESNLWNITRWRTSDWRDQCDNSDVWLLENHDGHLRLNISIIKPIYSLIKHIPLISYFKVCLNF